MPIGEKVEGSPCKRCGSTVRYKHITDRSKEGACVNCSSDRKEQQARKKLACETMAVGIKDPYRIVYMNGYNSMYATENQYPMSEIGKRCAWAAGHNDKWST